MAHISEQQYGETILKMVVERAGAEYVGVQELTEDYDRLLLFNSKKTGSTLAVHFNPKHIRQDQIQQEITARVAQSDAEFAEAKKRLPHDIKRKVAINLLGN
jgi:hypothetical protein